MPDCSTPGYSPVLRDLEDQTRQPLLRLRCFVKKQVAASARAAAWFLPVVTRMFQF
jgi:hypothetical protein